MGDEDLEVVPETLRNEAKRWLDNSIIMAWENLQVLRLNLNRAAFSAGPDNDEFSAAALYDSYQALQQHVADLLSQASIEFAQLGSAVNRAADSYGRTDLTAAQLLDFIYGDES